MLVLIYLFSFLFLRSPDPLQVFLFFVFYFFNLLNILPWLLDRITFSKYFSADLFSLCSPVWSCFYCWRLCFGLLCLFCIHLFCLCPQHLPLPSKQYLWFLKCDVLLYSLITGCDYHSHPIPTSSLVASCWKLKINFASLYIKKIFKNITNQGLVLMFQPVAVDKSLYLSSPREYFCSMSN